MIKKIRLLITALFIAPIFALPASAAAYNSFERVDCSSNRAPTSAVCNDRSKGVTNPITGSDGLLTGIVKIVSYIAGAAAIILMIVGGIKFATSGGDSNNVSSAKRTIIGALVGVLIVVFAQILAVYVLGQL